jgi:hypothetical protein
LVDSWGYILAGYAISWYENCTLDPSREIDIGLIVGTSLVRVAKGKVGRPNGSSVLEKTVKIRLSEAELAAVKEAASTLALALRSWLFLQAGCSLSYSHSLASWIDCATLS